LNPTKTTIINHFLEEHGRLLGGASLSPGRVHPADIVPIGEVTLRPGTDQNSQDFTARFQVGSVSVFYFGTITDNGRFTNEAVTGRRADGTMQG
jgi:hypothetical protein